MDKMSRDYDGSCVKLDSRFEWCKKDAFFTLLSYLGVILATWIAAYALSPDEISEMNYLFGFPLWYSVCTLICIGYTIVGIIWAVRSRKFTLDARGDDREVTES